MRRFAILLAVLVSGVAFAARPANEARSILSASPSITVSQRADGFSLRQSQSASAAASIARNGGEPEAGSFTQTIVRWVAVPPQSTLKAEVGRGEVVDREGATTPWQGDLIDPAFLPRTGDPVIYRGVSLAPVVIPQLLKTISGEVVALGSIELNISFTSNLNPSMAVPPAVMRAQDVEFLRSVVVNPYSPDIPQRDLAPTDRGSLAIYYPETLTDQDALDAINELAVWKSRTGLRVAVTPVDATGLTSSQFRDRYIKGNYPQEPTWDYAIIVGWDWRNEALEPDADYFFPTFDEPAAPADTISQDFKFGCLDGADDRMPDVKVGRIFAPNLTILQYVISRQLAYEKDPAPGQAGHEGEWFDNAFFAFDWQDPPANGAPFIYPSLKDMEIGGWALEAFSRIGMQTDSVCTYHPVFGADERPRQREREFLTGQGVAVGAILGYFFGTSDADEYDLLTFAETGGMNPFYIATNSHYGPLLTHSFFAAPQADEGTHHGPIAAVTSCNLAHYENYDNWLVGGGVRAITEDHSNNVGEVGLRGVLEVNSMWPFQVSEDDRIAFLHYLQMLTTLGDPSLNFYTVEPVRLQANFQQSYPIGLTSFSLRVTDGNQDVPGATVCVMQGERFKYVSTTDAGGEVAFTIPEALAEGTVSITITKPNAVPRLADIPVRMPAINLALTDHGFDDSQLGDNDRRLRNGETVALLSTYVNDGDDAARNVSVELRSDSPFVRFTPNPVNLTDIGSGESGTFAEQVRLALSPSCPGGTVIRIQADMTSGNNHWESAFEVTTSGPKFTVPNDQVDVRDLQRRMEAQISPTVFNRGDLAGTALSGVLVSLTDGITVTRANVNYPAIGVGANSLPDNPFRVQVDSAFAPGRVANFTLMLTGDNQARVTIPLELTIGVAQPSDPVGPDKYGYYCFDQGDTTWAEAPKFGWTEINPSLPNSDFVGTRLPLTDFQAWDKGEEESHASTVVDLPFPFKFYGEEYQQVVVCSNGWISFDTSNVHRSSPVSRSLGSFGVPNALVAVFWQDMLNQGNNAFTGVYSHYDEAAGAFVIEWSGLFLPTWIADRYLELPVNFEVKLIDPRVRPTLTSDGDIEIHYLQAPFVPGTKLEYPFPTIGLRNLDGTDGLEYTYHGLYNAAADSLRDQFSLKFTTSSQNAFGRLTGRVVRGVDGNPMVGVRIQHPYISDSFTGADGAFDLPLRAAIYSDLKFTLPTYGTERASFEITSGRTTDLGLVTIDQPHLQPPEPLSVQIQPDGHGGIASIPIHNSGRGSLEYSSRIVYPDSTESSFRIIETMPRVLFFDSTRFVYGLTWADSFYVAAKKRAGPVGQRNIIAVIKSDSVYRTMIQPLGDSLSTFINLAFDGDHFWAVCKRISVDPPVVLLVEFNRNANQIFRTRTLPFREDLNLPTITYAKERNSLFIAGQESNVIEISLNPDDNLRIVHTFDPQAPPDAFVPTGLAWNPYDVEGKPLYILQKVGNPGPNETAQKLIRLDPVTGEYRPWRLLPGVNGRTANGVVFLRDYTRDALCLAVSEDSSFHDVLRVIEIGPRTTFLVNGLEQSHGEVAPGGTNYLRLQFLPTGWPEDFYRFAIKVTHNGPGEPVYVPVELEVNDTASVGEGEDALPTSFGITGTYPNPFNSTLSIRFSVPNVEEGMLRIYDLTGREVTTLMQGKMAGRQSVIWDAGSVASGVYLVRLEADGNVDQRKVVLIR